MSTEIEFSPDDAHPQPAQPAAEPQVAASVDQTASEAESQQAPVPNAIEHESFEFPQKSAGGYHLSLPSVNFFDFVKKISDFNKQKMDKPVEELAAWRELADDAVDQYTVGGLYQDRFYDSTSEFHQGVQTKDGEHTSISSLKFKKTDGELKGEIALLKVSKALGLGDVVNIPLPHSGIWVTIKPPTETDLIDFYNSMFREKIMLGRATNGLTLSNFSVHVNSRLYDFIQRHIHSVNYGDISKDQLKNYMLIHDFPILAWGFACTMYPNGFDYQRACTHDLDQCTHISQAVLNITKLLWVDNKSLTDAQKVILSENRPNKLTAENYRKFIVEHVRVTPSSFTTTQGLKVKLKVPTFAEYTADGLTWINTINTAIETAVLSGDATANDEQNAKLELLNQHVKSSILRQFNHFIDYIEIDDNVISDRDTINSTLAILSANDDVRTEITDQIIKFKVNTTLAMIGIPEYKCPACGQPQNPHPEHEKFKTVIPLNAINVFFTMLTYRISKILEREV